MSTYIGIGYSKKPDWQEAAFEAALMVRKQLGSTKADLLIVLATADYCRAEILPAIKSVIDSPLLIGSSSLALILPDQILNKGLGLLAIKSETTTFTANSYTINATTPLRNAGFELTRGLIGHQHSQRQGCLFFADGIFRNSKDFLHGVGEVMGFSAAVIGALSSRAAEYKHNYQFFNDKLLESHAVAAMIHGSNRFFTESRHSFKILGRPRLTTKSSDFVLRTIEDKPAINLYEEFFKEKADKIRNDPFRLYQQYPLGFYDEKTQRYTLRSPIDILTDGSIVFHGEVPESTEVHLMISNKESCLNSSFDAANALKEAVGDRTIEVLFVIESGVRARILGRDALKSINTIRETLSLTIPVFGMYSFGEIAPWKMGSTNRQLNFNNGGIVLGALT